MLDNVPPDSVSVSGELLKVVSSVESSTPVGGVTVTFAVKLLPLTMNVCAGVEAVPVVVVPRVSVDEPTVSDGVAAGAGSILMAAWTTWVLPVLDPQFMLTVVAPGEVDMPQKFVLAPSVLLMVWR